MDGNLGPVHVAVIDGSSVTYQRHLCGPEAGCLHTHMGDFGSFGEMTAYVRARNAEPKNVPTPFHPRRGEAPSNRG